MAVSLSLVEVKTQLKSLGYDVAFYEFDEEKDGIKPPEPPFIVYLVGNTESKFADNTSYFQVRDLDIELYTNLKNESIEIEVEALLNQMELPFMKFEETIHDEDLYLVRYEMKLIGG